METLLRAGLSNAVTATVLALLVACLSRPLARRPAILHGFWLLVLIKLVTPPVFELAIPWPIAASPARADLAEIRVESDDVMLAGTASVPDDLAWTERPGEEISNIRLSPAPETPSHVSPLDWRLWTGTAWITGSLVLLGVSALRIRRFHGLLRSASPATGEEREWVKGLANVMELRRVPDVYWVRARLSPLVWSPGLRPRLVLPRTLWKTLDEHQRSTLVVHELAHLKRGDHLVRFLELVVTALYWWHPLLWWMRQSLRDAEEQCCDAWVVWAFPDAARAYAQTLLDTLDFVHRSDQPEPLLASGLGKVPHLRRRLTMIMTGTTFRALGVRGMLGLLFVGGIMLPVGATWAQKAEERKDVRVVVTADDASDDVIQFTTSPVLRDHVVVSLGDGQGEVTTRVTGPGHLDEIIKKLEARIAELKKASRPTDAARDEIKSLAEVVDELKKAKTVPDQVTYRQIVGHDGPSGPNTSEIIKLRQQVFELRKGMDAKLKEIQAVQAKIRELGGDTGDVPLVEWRRTPKKTEFTQRTYTVVKPVVTFRSVKDDTVKAAADKKARVKELMGKAMTAYAAGNYVECETLAKKAAEIDPNEVAAQTLAFKAQLERRFEAYRDKVKTDSGRESDPSRLESLEKRLKALQDEFDRLKKSTRRDAPRE